MVDMKRKLLICLSIIALVVLSIFVVKIVKSELLKKDIANGIKNFLNEGEYCKYLPEDQMIWLDNAKRDNVNNYDITEFVNYLIDTCKKCVSSKLGEYKIKEHTIYKRTIPSYEGITIVDMMDWYYTKPNYMMAYITNEDIELYKNDKLEEKIHNELKNKFEYKDGKWYVGGNESKKIELVYGLYANYTPDNRVEKVKPKMVTNVMINEKYIQNLGYKGRRMMNITIEYVNDNNERIKYSDRVGFSEKDKNHFDLAWFSPMYYSYPKERKRTWPKLQVCHYTQDAEDAEFRAWEKAIIKAEEERDPSTIQVDEQSMEIEMFKKYNQYAEIIVFEYEDGSKKSIFRKCSVTKKPDIIIRDYMKRELPYKNKSLKEVMELYINDKDQYSIDEELLKTGKALVKYESYRRP